MKLITISLATAWLMSAGSVFAEKIDISEHQTAVLDCVSRMEAHTTWAQCRTLMFLPCQSDAVGSPQHVMCLTGLRDDWAKQMQSRFGSITEKVTDEGRGVMLDLLKDWLGYVSQSCAAVGKSKADISEDSAKLGCETSETVGLIAELQACLDGRSVAPYCEMKE